ncbi:MAG: hypothetical protein ACXWCN_18845, partial [Caldimonas sp.]
GNRCALHFLADRHGRSSASSCRPTPCGAAERMGILAIALGGLAIVVGAGATVLVLRRRRPGASSGAAPQATAPAANGRPDTALGELRDLREALTPAEHSRVERRRTPSAGAAVSGERRRNRPR